MESNDWIYKARKGLIDNSLQRMKECEDFSYLDTKVFYELSKFGVGVIARKEGLFSSELWQKEENREELMKMLEDFLWAHVR